MATGNGSAAAPNGGQSRALVFVSYSKHDKKWKEELLPHLIALQLDDQLEVWHDDRIDTGGKWRDEIETALDRSAAAVCLVSKHFLATEFIVKEEVRYFLEEADARGLPILPVLLGHCPWQSIRWIKEIQMVPGKGRTIADDHKRDFDKVFAKLANDVSKIVRDRSFKLPEPPPPQGPEPDIDIANLPVTGSELFGRQAELKLLDDAWAAQTTNAVALVAWGGVGKSTLVNKWLEGMKADNWRGAHKVLGWSFFSQGTGERATSADQFIDHALRFFNDPEPEAGSPWAKGERLAELARKNKALLILDGLEPLQDRYQGIKDPALQRLVEELARDNVGLCVITTREAVKELEDFSASTIARDLEQISSEAGRALLRVKGVRGTDAELQRASEAFANHALAINLLANWLRAIPGHPIAKAYEISDLDIPPEKGRQPRRVMAAFAERFGEESAEVDVLRLLGLFDRPATAGAIAALRKPPPILELTDHVWGLDEAGWLRLVESIRELGLIAPKAIHASDELDAHPLVREHFGAELREKHIDAWGAGHERLYGHFKALPEKKQPDTLEELAPLLQAVFHGCQAGRHQEALDEVYLARIVRGNQAYVTTQLGAFGADLAALAGFFDPPWKRPVALISERDQAFVLGQAGFRLRALGRLKDAVQPVRVSLDGFVSQQVWVNAAATASNLSQLQLTLGEVAEAIRLAEQSVEYADRSENAFWHMGSRSTLADARHRAGERTRAEGLFQDAERLQADRQPGYPRLYSLQGYLCCDLLLDVGRYAEVRDRARQLFEWRLPSDSLLSIALDNLSLARAKLFAYEADRSGDLADPKRLLNQAVEGLRKAGAQEFIPLGLLARAAYFRIAKQINPARRDLDEARRIATRSGMRLHECDAHLEYARLELAQGNREAARGHLARAEEMVAATGYHRRDRNIDELKAAIA
jgi:tetratricopeptide (TPR) repeat protein